MKEDGKDAEKGGKPSICVVRLSRDVMREGDLQAFGCLNMSLNSGLDSSREHR